MKKASLVALSVMIAGIAFANTLYVPFFTDSETATLLADGTKRSTRTFISLKNVSTVTQTIWLQYVDPNGNSVTPAANTFALPAGAQVSWRPTLATYNLSGEGTAGTPSGQSIPNMVSGSNGSATIFFQGAGDDPGAVVGRVQGSSQEFNFHAVGRDSYGLGLGSAHAN
jgi:hypothetical protein